MTASLVSVQANTTSFNRKTSSTSDNLESESISATSLFSTHNIPNSPMLQTSIGNDYNNGLVGKLCKTFFEWIMIIVGMIEILTIKTGYVLQGNIGCKFGDTNYIA